MKKILFTSLLCFFCLGVVCVAVADDWKDIKPGLSYRQLILPYNETQVVFRVLKLDPSRFLLKPISAEKNAMISTLVLQNNALAGVNANFFDTEGKVLGLVKKDGAVIHPVKQISWWSVFCLKHDKASIIHTSQYREEHCDQAVQAGPRLVVDGVVPVLKDEWSRKTAIGINDLGEVLIVVTSEQIPIKFFAEVISRSESNQGLGCKNAINLDGGGSTQLFVTGSDPSFNVPSFVEIPVGLGVFAKTAQ